MTLDMETGEAPQQPTFAFAGDEVHLSVPETQHQRLACINSMVTRTGMNLITTLISLFHCCYYHYYTVLTTMFILKRLL